MSSLIVQVKKIDRVLDHPNADRLQIAQIEAWDCIIKKGQFKAGDKVVFVPPESVIPDKVGKAHDCLKYLKGGNRVGSARLRGVVSHGIIIAPDDPNWKVGKDVADHYGITKYVPKPGPRRRGIPGDQESPHPLFANFTDMENLRHFPDAFEEEEQVFATEKLHGSRVRLGLIEGKKMAGSKGCQWKHPVKEVSDNWIVSFLRKIKVWRKPKATVPDFEAAKNHTFWFPWSIPEVEAAMLKLSYYSKINGGKGNVVMFGEVFGANIQKGVHYGTPDKIDFRCFGMMVDGKYLNYDEEVEVANQTGLKLVPLVYRGPFSVDKIKEVSEGKTLVNNESGKSHIREGVVIRPVKERRHDKIGRLILKYPSDSYLLAKESGDFGDEEE